MLYSDPTGLTTIERPQIIVSNDVGSDCILHMDVVSSKTSQVELSFEARVKRAHDKNISTSGERLTPEYTATVTKH